MDPVENAERWRRWVVQGSAEAIARVFDALDARLPAGWKRLVGDDLQRYSTLVKPESGWYSLETTSAHVGVVLCIDRLRESEIRGGWAWFAGPPYPTADKPSVPAAWAEVGRFLDEAVIPAAMSVGVTFQTPTAQDIFLGDLPFDVRDRLQEFTKFAHKSLPLDRVEADLWHRFVIAVYRAKVIVDPEPLICWLTGSGWPRDAAAELYLRFFDQCRLLSSYQDEVSAA